MRLDDLTGERKAFLKALVAKLNEDHAFRDLFRAAVRAATEPGVERARAMNEPEAGLATLFPQE